MCFFSVQYSIVTLEQNRIISIDALRSFAILSMVFGHTTSILMSEQFRRPDFWPWAFHLYFSGLTAPVFFFASGMIFTYLLFKSSEHFNKARVIKGFKRTLYLLAVGFLIQISIKGLIHNPLGFMHYSHVLQCIGLSILIINLLYVASMGKAKLFLILTFIIANFAFLITPFLTDLSLLSERNPISLFLSNSYTIFPLFPWAGFSLFGALFGLVTLRHTILKKPISLLVIFIFGFMLQRFAWHSLAFVYSGFENYRELVNLNVFTYYRLGEVLMTYAFVTWLTHKIKIPEWMLIPGRETLAIYVLHNIVIYGALFSIGYSTVYYHSLSFIQTTILLFFTLVAAVLFSNVLYKMRNKYTFLKYFK